MMTFDDYIDAAKDMLRYSKEQGISSAELIEALQKDDRYTIGNYRIKGMISALRYVTVYGNDTLARDIEEVLCD